VRWLDRTRNDHRLTLSRSRASTYSHERRFERDPDRGTATRSGPGPATAA
jgi:hypothetical protein